MRLTIAVLILSMAGCCVRIPTATTTSPPPAPTGAADQPAEDAADTP